MVKAKAKDILELVCLKARLIAESVLWYGMLDYGHPRIAKERMW